MEIEKKYEQLQLSRSMCPCGLYAADNHVQGGLYYVDIITKS